MRDHPRARSVRASAIALLAATAVLGGCTEKHEASTALPSTSAAVTTESLPTVGPADFPVPDEARTKDAAGAEAFLRYWIDLSNRLQGKLDGQPLRDLGPHCQECLRIAQDFEEVAAAGQHYEGGDITLNDVTTAQINGNKATINFGARQEAVRLLDSDGTTVDALALQPNLISGIALQWSESDETWLVDGIDIG